LLESLTKIQKTHSETANVFKGISKAIQNEPLDCVLEVSRAKIAAEISHSTFLAAVLNNTTYISEEHTK
jgi:hypothetical protein